MRELLVKSSAWTSERHSQRKRSTAEQFRLGFPPYIGPALSCMVCRSYKSKVMDIVIGMVVIRVVSCYRPVSTDELNKYKPEGAQKIETMVKNISR